MKKLLLILLICLTSTGAFAQDEWTKKDTSYQAVFLTTLAMDWLQTKEIARNSDYYETNIILGKHPSQNEVDLYSLSAGLLHTAIAYHLPKDYRRIWQCFWIGIETMCVTHNHRIGIRIKF